MKQPLAMSSELFDSLRTKIRTRTARIGDSVSLDGGMSTIPLSSDNARPPQPAAGKKIDHTLKKYDEPNKTPDGMPMLKPLPNPKKTAGSWADAPACVGRDVLSGCHTPSRGGVTSPAEFGFSAK